MVDKIKALKCKITGHKWKIIESNWKTGLTICQCECCGAKTTIKK